MRTSDTICYKHDKISDLAKQLMNIASDIESTARDIDSIVNDAKDDGQRMENGLDSKRQKIEMLELNLELMEKDRDYWKQCAEDFAKEVNRLSSL